MAHAEWNKPVPPPRPLKVRDVFLLTAEARETELVKIQKAHPKRQIISIPPEMAFGTGDHATTSTCLRLLVDVSRERKCTKWTVADLGTGTLHPPGHTGPGPARVFGFDDLYAD